MQDACHGRILHWPHHWHSLLSQDNVPDDPPLSNTGLNLIQSVNGVGSFTGRTLSDSGAAGSTFVSLLADYTDADGWGDAISCVV